MALDQAPDVKMVFKIPFRIETPVGSYNPDWAVYLTRNGEEKLYFILETKGATSLMELRSREQLKIHCGKKHFATLENGAEMQTSLPHYRALGFAKNCYSFLKTQRKQKFDNQ